MDKHTHPGANRVYQAIHRALADAGADETDATVAARDVAARINEAHDSRRYAFRSNYSHTLNRAFLTHTFRGMFPWDGRETRRANQVLTRVEADIGVRFPDPTVEERFRLTPRSVWDMLLNTWWCYECSTWVSGDGAGALSPLRCRCGHRVIL